MLFSSFLFLKLKALKEQCNILGNTLLYITLKSGEEINISLWEADFSITGVNNGEYQNPGTDAPEGRAALVSMIRYTCVFQL